MHYIHCIATFASLQSQSIAVSSQRNHRWRKIGGDRETMGLKIWETQSMIIYGDTMVIFHTDIMGIYSEYHQQYDTKHREVSLFAQACATPTTQPLLITFSDENGHVGVTQTDPKNITGKKSLDRRELQSSHQGSQCLEFGESLLTPVYPVSKSHMLLFCCFPGISQSSSTAPSFGVVLLGSFAPWRILIAGDIPGPERNGPPLGSQFFKVVLSASH